MLYAVFGDIHGNKHAFQAVLEDLEAAEPQGVLCVGDIVGYGAYPAECVRMVRDLDAVVVAGNHDWATLGKIGIDYFNADARDSIIWTRQHLSDQELEYLAGLPLVATVEDATLVHSTLFSPEYFDYMQTLYDVRLSFDRLENRVCFCGHSHVPVMFLDTQPVDCFLEPELHLGQEKAIVNVGSVGQPRDLDPRASYALYDSDEGIVHYRRVEYDVGAASESIGKAGLPATNAARIMLGR